MVEFGAETQFIKERESFNRGLHNLTPENRAIVMLAYSEAEKAHKGEFRDSGERFFEHPEQTALILLKSGITKPVILAAALLHDTVENTPYFGNLPSHTYEESRTIAKQNMASLFGPEIAEMVISVSKPRGIDLINLSREELAEMYRRQFKTVSEDSLLLKMADKLHNVSKVYSCSFERQEGQIEETESFYMPLFDKVLLKYPKEGMYLMDRIKIEIFKWKENGIRN